jgi:hypothetical protein
MKNQTITVEMLVKMGACHSQVMLFRRLFGKSVKVTLKGCVKAAQQFDWNWASRNLLTATAEKAYQEATATAWKAYQEAKAPAWKAYQEATAIAFARCVKEWGVRE